MKVKLIKLKSTHNNLRTNEIVGETRELFDQLNAVNSAPFPSMIAVFGEKK